MIGNITGWNPEIHQYFKNELKKRGQRILRWNGRESRESQEKYTRTQEIQEKISCQMC